jgi:probable phosphoglycerate mutase
MARPHITLVRHGETEWSRSGRHTGRTDIPLTSMGRRQAVELGEMLHGRSFDAVFISPLSRASQTCELAGLGGLAEPWDDLREWDYGEYEGRRTVDVRQTDPTWTVWTHVIHGGESLAQVAARADRVIETLVNHDGDVAVFAHGHVLRVLGARWCGLEAVAGRVLALATASISELGFEREIRVIRSWNQLCHLRGTEPPD